MSAEIIQLRPELSWERTIEARDDLEHFLRRRVATDQTGKLSAHPSGWLLWTHDGEVFKVTVDLEHRGRVWVPEESDDPE